MKRALVLAAMTVLAACGGDDATEPGNDGGGVSDTLDATADVAMDAGDAAIDGVDDTDSDAGDVAVTDADPDAPPVPTVTLPSTDGRVPASLTREHACSVRVNADGARAWAPTLSSTGCYDLGEGTPQPVAAALPYLVRVPLWSDSADKARFLLLPPDGTMAWDDTRTFELPVGTVLIKEFRLDGVLVESRFVQLDTDGWQAATYRWRDDLSDADVVLTSQAITVGDTPWLLPGPDDCVLCHTAASGFVLGLRGDQLWLDADAFGLGPVNQVAAWHEAGLFDAPLPAELELWPLTPLDDPEATVGQRARSYLDANCANCHQPGGAPHAELDLRITTALDATRAVGVYPLSGDLGLGRDARNIAPGDPDHSVLALRMADRREFAMPQLGTYAVDEQAVAVVREWIAGLDSTE